MLYLLKKKSLKISAACAAFLASLNLYAAPYRFEGVYDQPDGEQRFFLVQLFIPFNPRILAIGCDSKASAKCAIWWPHGVFCSESALKTNRHANYDFLWIESEEDEVETLRAVSDLLNKTKAIYSSTHPGNSFSSLRSFLEAAGFTLLSHWYWEGEKGNAIFLRKEIFDAAMMTLNCSPTPRSFVDHPSFFPVESCFRKIGQKPQEHSLGPIDYIYMINLDERPEKYAKAAEGLQLYGIAPYRFSAVNGWNLSLEMIEKVGVKFPQATMKDRFMGSVYHEIDGVKYRSNEFIQEVGRTYFSMGLSQGSIGIVLSHLSVLQDAFDSGYRTIWVMEDDVESVDDPRQIPELIRTLDTLAPDWDILFTDIDTKDVHGKRVFCRALAARPNFCVETLQGFLSRFYPVGNDFSRIGMRYGAYSMILRRSGMEKILHHFKSYGIFLPYDMDFWLVPNLQMYTVNRDIVSHAPGSPTDNNLPNYKNKE
jgi:GR25 family glycosyltransferase involved in LPS biosynthesis